jgi:hypothetical protein
VLFFIANATGNKQLQWKINYFWWHLTTESFWVSCSDLPIIFCFVFADILMFCIIIKIDLPIHELINIFYIPNIFSAAVFFPYFWWFSFNEN